MKWLKGSAILLIILLVLAVLTLPRINRVDRDGTVTLKALSAPVKVIRDEKGMPSIFAKNFSDLIIAQGFVMAQERLFQMELMKLLATGRISELAGEKALKTDIQMRTIGFPHHAREQVRILSPQSRKIVENYITGINALINECPEQVSLEFSLAGIAPQPWQPEDVIAILYFMGWNSAANLNSEIISLMLHEKLGTKNFRELTPLNSNPVDGVYAKNHEPLFKNNGLAIAGDKKLLSLLDTCKAMSVGSNNWVLSADRSPGQTPVLVNDPHLDARMIPGPFMAMGLHSPEVHAVGGCIPGIPGFITGRNENCAVGITNSYHDAQDLFIETIDPKRKNYYREGNRSLPFTLRKETLRIRDKEAPGGYREKTITIKSTRRGPIVSNIIKGLETDKVLSLRWSPFETKIPDLGFDRFLTARNAKEMRSALKDVRHVMLNCVYADKKGTIGWTTTGRIPLREKGIGIIPLPATPRDPWKGWISFEQAPSRENPKRGWLGTSNHNTVPRGYPHYISSYFSPHYRYSRLAELMKTKKVFNEDDHWGFMRDTKNLMAASTRPALLAALGTDKKYASLTDTLKKWDLHDNKDSAGALCFQVLYYNLFRETFRDEMGEELLKKVINVQYFWQERFEKMVIGGSSPFFDNTGTTKKETFTDCIRAAADKSLSEIKKLAGSDPESWRWGDVHHIHFFNPIGRSGILKKLLGREFEMGGSHQTLYRAIYSPVKPFSVDVSAALRMVVDLSNDERVLAVLSCGTTGRTFDPHTGDQMESYMKGEKKYWWFSKKAVMAHKKYSMTILPAKKRGIK